MNGNVLITESHFDVLVTTKYDELVYTLAENDGEYGKEESEFKTQALALEFIVNRYMHDHGARHVCIYSSQSDALKVIRIEDVMMFDIIENALRQVRA